MVSFGLLGTLGCDADKEPSAFFRHLLPRIQPFEEGLFWREPAKVAGCAPDVDCRCDCRYACGIFDNPLRRYQDTIAGGGSKG